MRKSLLIVLLVLCLAPPMFAVGTATLTTSDVGHGISKYSIAWTSTAGGAVSANLFDIKGVLLAVKIVPSAATAPTALYDVTLVDTDAVDLLNGLGANQSATVGAYYTFNPPIYLDGTQQLDLVVANAGAAKLGTVSIWVTR